MSVINETQTTVSLTAALPRHNVDNSLPVTRWRVQYERQSTDGDTLAATFNTSTSLTLTLINLLFWLNAVRCPDPARTAQKMRADPMNVGDRMVVS